MKNLKFLMPLALIIVTLSITPAGLLTGNEEPATGRYVGEQWVRDDGTAFRLRLIQDPGISVDFQVPDFLIMPYEKYLELHQEGKLTIKATRYVTFKSETGGSWELAVVEPRIIREDIPISGSLTPGTFRDYGPYSSAVAIAVSVTWAPGDQTLGIAIADAGTGEGYGYWYTGGSAWVQFSTDWTRSYYIFILSHKDNTKTITYSGRITLYIW